MAIVGGGLVGALKGSGTLTSFDEAAIGLRLRMTAACVCGRTDMHGTWIDKVRMMWLVGPVVLHCIE